MEREGQLASLQPWGALRGRRRGRGGEPGIFDTLETCHTCCCASAAVQLCFYFLVTK